MDLDPYNWEIILTWKKNKYKDPVYTFKVRDKEKMPTHTESLSHSQIRK
jgi:methylmalonyl-CoA mutase